MPILISIDRAKKRQERIAKQNIECNLVKYPVDGNALDNAKTFLSPRAFYDFDKRKIDHRTITSLGAIGCYLSHRNAWKEIIENNKPDLIIEDDITVESEDYKKFIKDWICCQHNKPRIMWMQYGFLNRNPNLYWGTGAYIINPRAAKILYKNSLPIDIQVDSYMHLMIKKLNWDLELCDKLFFTQYETYSGPFKSLCQESNKNLQFNKYLKLNPPTSGGEN